MEEMKGRVEGGVEARSQGKEWIGGKVDRGRKKRNEGKRGVEEEVRKE